MIEEIDDFCQKMEWLSALGYPELRELLGYVTFSTKFREAPGSQATKLPQQECPPLSW